MSIFAAPSFYNQADQNIFNQVDRFITQERFRLGDPLQKNISFNSGITNAAAATPFILPINQGGGGDGPGGGIDTNDFEEQSTTADDFGFGLKGDDPSMNMTEDEEEAINAYNNPALNSIDYGTIGSMFAGFTNPITGILGLMFNKRRKQQQAMEQAKAAATAARAAANKAAAARGDLRGGYQAGYDSDFMEGGGGGKDAGQEASSPGSSGPGGSDSMGSFMNGGLVDLVDIYD